MYNICISIYIFIYIYLYICIWLILYVARHRIESRTIPPVCQHSKLHSECGILAGSRCIEAHIAAAPPRGQAPENLDSTRCSNANNTIYICQKNE